MSLHAQIQQNHQETKKPKTPSQNHSKTIEKTKKNKKNKVLTHYGGPGLARMILIIAEILHIIAKIMRIPPKYQISAIITAILANPDPPQCVRTLFFLVFFSFLDGFAMVLGRGLWVFWFFLVSWWFCYIQTWKGIDCLQHPIYIYI